MVLYNKKKLLSPPSLPVVIDEVPLFKVSNKRALGIIIIDEDLSFTPHIEFITKKCKQAYDRLTLFPSLNPHLALQLYKSFIRSRLEFGSIMWGFKLYQREHLKMLESAQRGALFPILKTMRSTPTETLEEELSVLLIDPRIEELQCHEAGKLLTREEKYIKANIEEQSHRQKFESPFCNL